MVVVDLLLQMWTVLIGEMSMAVRQGDRTCDGLPEAVPRLAKSTLGGGGGRGRDSEQGETLTRIVYKSNASG